jgi:hypothetical protein
VDSGSATRTANPGRLADHRLAGGDAGLTPSCRPSTPARSSRPSGPSASRSRAPFGLVTKYDADFIGRYHALTSALRTINVAPTVSYRPVPWFSSARPCSPVRHRAGSPRRWTSARRARWRASAPSASRRGRVRRAGDGSGRRHRRGWTLGRRVGAGGRHARRRLLPVRPVPRTRGRRVLPGAPGPLANSVNFRNTNGRAKLTDAGDPVLRRGAEGGPALDAARRPLLDQLVSLQGIAGGLRERAGAHGLGAELARHLVPRARRRVPGRRRARAADGRAYDQSPARDPIARRASRTATATGSRSAPATRCCGTSS